MAWKQYDYTCQWDSAQDMVCRPLLEVELCNGDKTYRGLGLIDSGSDRTLVDSEIAGALGINLKLCKTVKVEGVGQRTGYICDVIFKFTDTHIEIEIPVIFLDGLPFPLLLGQRHFFSLLDIRFEKHQNRFFLKKST